MSASCDRCGGYERDADSDSTTVRGTFPYVVELWVERANPGWRCTCPAAEDGSFCKHCVAVGQLVTHGDESNDRVIPDLDRADADIAAHVEGMSRRRLIEHRAKWSLMALLDDEGW